MIWKVKLRFWPPPKRSRISSTVVSAATTSTTNMTGFLTIVRGSSFANEAQIAGTTILGSKRLLALAFAIEVAPKRGAQRDEPDRDLDAHQKEEAKDPDR